MILNIFSAFVIEAFILEFSVTSDDNGAGGKRPQSSLTDRIAAMGLGYGKAEATKQGNGNAVADVEQLVPDEDDNDFIDADHGTAQLPNNKEATTASSSDNMAVSYTHLTLPTILLV